MEVTQREKLKQEIVERAIDAALLEYHDYDDLVECEGYDRKDIEELINSMTIEISFSEDK